MKIRSVEAIIAPPSPHMVGDGFRVHNFFPSQHIDMERMSPFIMLDYNAKVDFSPSKEPRGVGVHPHRGFETVTIAYEGAIAHHDSTGSHGVIEKGGVQWMTAGAGILHKEYHEKEFSRRGGLFQMVQLWVNLPAKSKNVPPGYQAINFEDIKRVALDKDAGTIELIAGSYNGVSGPAKTHTPMSVYNIKLKAGKKITVPVISDWHTALLVIDGSARINEDSALPQDHFALMANDGDYMVIEAIEDATLLVISGEPIREPIAAYGPFVMNTHEELVQSYADMNAGKYGYLED